MSTEMTPEEEYEFYAKTENRELVGTPRRRTAKLTAPIPVRFPDVDLGLFHLGGTRILGVLLTMDDRQGVEAVRLIDPTEAIPIHHGDYGVFRSPVEDFVAEATRAGLGDRLRVLERGDTHRFALRPAAGR